MARPAQFILTAAAATLLAATLPAYSAFALVPPELVMSLEHESKVINDGTVHDATVGVPYRIAVTLTNNSEENLEKVVIDSLDTQGLSTSVRCDILKADSLVTVEGVRLDRGKSYSNCSLEVTAKEAGLKTITVSASGNVAEKDTPSLSAVSAQLNFKAAENTNPGTNPNTQPEDPKKPDVNPSVPAPQDPKDSPKPEDPKAQDPQIETPKPQDPKVQDPKDAPKPQDPKAQDPKTENPKPLDPKMQDPQTKPQAPAGDAPVQPKKPEVTQNGAQPGVPPQGGTQGAKQNAPQGAGKLAKTGVSTPLAVTVLIAGLGGAALLGRRLATK